MHYWLPQKHSATTLDTPLTAYYKIPSTDTHMTCGPHTPNHTQITTTSHQSSPSEVSPRLRHSQGRPMRCIIICQCDKCPMLTACTAKQHGKLSALQHWLTEVLNQPVCMLCTCMHIDRDKYIVNSNNAVILQFRSLHYTNCAQQLAPKNGEHCCTSIECRTRESIASYMHILCSSSFIIKIEMNNA